MNVKSTIQNLENDIKARKLGFYLEDVLVKMNNHVVDSEMHNLTSSCKATNFESATCRISQEGRRLSIKDIYNWKRINAPRIKDITVQCAKGSQELE